MLYYVYRLRKERYSKMNDKVKTYAEGIVRNSLANARGVYPVEVTTEELAAAIDTGVVGNYKLFISDEFSSIENGKEKHHVNVALVDSKDGQHYYSNVITL